MVQDAGAEHAAIKLGHATSCGIAPRSRYRRFFQPEVAARAIVFASTARRREIYVGVPTLKAILANKLAPGLLDRLLATKGYSGQLTRS